MFKAIMISNNSNCLIVNSSRKTPNPEVKVNFYNLTTITKKRKFINPVAINNMKFIKLKTSFKTKDKIIIPTIIIKRVKCRKQRNLKSILKISMKRSLLC